jgi:predicted DNA-binding protein YlxM (UPF0122 family)
MIINKIWMFNNRLRGENHPNAKLNSKQVKQIRILYNQGFSISVIARNFNISRWNIRDIIKNKIWTHI